jgi:hypothetical protein
MGSRFNTLLNEHKLKRNNNSLGYYTYVNNNLEIKEQNETIEIENDIHLTNIYENNYESNEVKIDKINPLNHRFVKKDDITKKKPLKYSVNFKDVVNMNRNKIKQLKESQQSQEQNNS